MGFLVVAGDPNQPEAVVGAMWVTAPRIAEKEGQRDKREEFFEVLSIDYVGVINTSTQFV